MQNGIVLLSRSTRRSSNVLAEVHMVISVRTVVLPCLIMGVATQVRAAPVHEDTELPAHQERQMVATLRVAIVARTVGGRWDAGLRRIFERTKTTTPG